MAAISGGKTYHHGDLRNALIGAAVDLACEGGPERVVLREAARRVGVSPTAAYRHFEGRCELLAAVRDHARRALADSMERAAARVPGADDPALAAEARLAAVCRGYVAFAVEQPGLYRSAFGAPRTAPGDGDHGAEGGTAEVRAFTLLTDALGAVAATARPPRASRPAADAAAWSAVHGLSLLLLEGPLRRLPAQRRDDVVDSTLAMVVSGTRNP
ncbi:TetR/AcrR family transcriptional regulator [Streptomyces roseicoloratus]|uniref:TetR/AcrR family transcriptional regulator n=1 Tax=Streptomyces roseicoloratus TaxID=2508722 RepID=A0ABY9RPK6_9ACTN|nr:TetR/AcrR family transcriptional regulator [Streptomyces roseicoloratus]WMX44126.1 TetR/AcrR family transcriptional regulator [Streptomyces roseicoloratus]